MASKNKAQLKAKKADKGKKHKAKRPKTPRCTAWCPAYEGEFQEPWWVHPELHCTKKAGHTYQHHDKSNGWNWDDVYFE